MTARRPEIYLHIGPPKTATTYMQDILWGNKTVLEEQGIQLIGPRGIAHFHAAMDLRGRTIGGHADPQVDGAWMRLATAAMRERSGRALISHEFFAGATKAQVQRVAADLEGADLHIVFTARDLGRQVPAVWQEGTKNRSVVSFDDYLARLFNPDEAERRKHAFWRAHDPVRVLKRWAAITPVENIHVLTAPPPGAKSGDLWTRFASVLGIDSGQLDMTVARSNASLSYAEAEVLRLVNLQIPEDMDWSQYQRMVKRRFNHLANQQRRGDRIRIPERYKEIVQEESARSQKRIAETGYPVTGDLSDLEVLDKAFGPNDQLSAEQVTEAASVLLAHVLTNPVMKGREVVPETPAQRRRRKASDLFHRGQAKLRRMLRRG